MTGPDRVALIHIRLRSSFWLCLLAVAVPQGPSAEYTRAGSRPGVEAETTGEGVEEAAAVAVLAVLAWARWAWIFGLEVSMVFSWPFSPIL